MQIDPVRARKLATLLKKVAHGTPLAVAAVEAGIGSAELERIMKDVERELYARAREADSPPDPHTKATKPEAKPAKKKKNAKKSGGLALIAYADGGSRGNPGKAGCAAIIFDADGAELLRRARLLGKTTNNVAEYEAVLLALGLCHELGARDVTLRLDSELVVRQVDGSYKVKHPELQRLHARVHEFMKEFDSVEIEHVPREKNKDTDKLVNAALDGKDLD